MTISRNLANTGQLVSSTGQVSLTTGVSGTLPAANGGTGQNAYATGDMLYSDNTNSLAKLSGNTSTTKQFLTQTGTGSASQAPAWGTISGSDVTSAVSSATNVAGGAANKIVYQTGSSTTGFIDAPVSSNTALIWNGSAFAWGSAGATITDNTSTNTDYYPVWANASSGSLTTAYVTSTKLTYNPGLGLLKLTSTDQTGTLVITDTGTSGANIKLTGNGATTPNKYVRAYNGNFEVVNSAYGAAIFTLSDAGAVTASSFSGSGASLTSLNASNLSSGTVGTARLGSGTASSSTYLRGDQTWATISGTPAGMVAFFAMSTAPTGFLKANGAAVSRTTYASLFAAIGTTFGSGDGSTTFNVPDMRGYFPRGWSDGSSVDSGRTFGTTQTDAFQGHYHNILGRYINGTGGGSLGPLGTNNGAATPTDLENNASTIENNATYGTARVASETRPVNVALLACISY